MCDPYASSVIFAICCTVACEAGANCLVCFEDGLLSHWKYLIQISLNKYLTFGQLQPPASPVLRRCWETNCGSAAAGWKVAFGLLISDGTTMARKQQKEIFIYMLCLGEPVLAVLWLAFSCALLFSMCGSFLKCETGRGHLEHWILLLAPLGDNIYI